MNTKLKKTASYALTLGAYILSFASIFMFIILALDSHKIATFRAAGNYSAANIFFLKYFLGSFLSFMCAACMSHYSKILSPKK